MPATETATAMETATAVKSIPKQTVDKDLPCR
jgi:hypothetical protein